MATHEDVVALDAQSLAVLGLHGAGRNVRIVARRLSIGEGVVLGSDVVIAGEEVEIGEGVVVRAGADLRSHSLRIGMRSLVGDRVSVLAADVFEIGMASAISDGVEITCRSFSAGDLLFFGDRLVVGGGGHFESTAHLKIGHRVALGSHCLLNANRPIYLEDQVGSGDYLSLWTHGFHFGHSILDGFRAVYEPIHIERNVWLAHHVTVLPGVRIGENTIVGACSVVTNSLPANVIAAGVPATARKQLKVLPLDDERALQILTDILQRWGTEMEWKGWRVEREGHREAEGEIYLFSPEGDRRGLVLLLRSRDEDPRRTTCDFVIVISLDERPDLVARLSGSSTLFEVRRRSFRGKSFDVSEDLRDFLRRNSIPCGSQNLFQSIQPMAFRHLKAMV